MSRTGKRNICASIRALLCLVAFSSSLSGCWDRREINDVGFAMASSIDYSEDDGLYHVTSQIAVPTAMSQSSRGTGNSGVEPVMLIHAAGKTIGETQMQLQRQMSRKFNASHRRVLIVGERTAQHGLQEILDQVSRLPTNRLRVYLIITKGCTARGLLELPYPLEAYPAEGIRELDKLEHGTTLTLRDFFIMSTMPGEDPLIPVFEMTGNKVHRFKTNGVAVFRNLKLAGYLTEAKSQSLMLMRNQLRDGAYQITVPSSGSHPLTLIVKSSQSKSTVTVENGKPIVTYHVKLEGAVTDNTTNLDLLNPKHVKELNAAWNKKVTEQCQQAIQELHQLKSDALGVGAQIYRHEPDLWTHHLEKNWEDQQFAKQEVRVEVETRVEQVGMIGPPLHLRDSEVQK